MAASITGKRTKDDWCEHTNIYSKLLSRKHIRRPTKDYNIDPEKASKWINQHCQEEQKQFARALIDNITYISFDDFLNSLGRVTSNQLLPLLSKPEVKLGSKPKEKLWTPWLSTFPLTSDYDVVKDIPLWVTRWALKLVPELYSDNMCKYWSLDPIQSLKHGVNTFVLFNNIYYSKELTFIASEFIKLIQSRLSTESDEVKSIIANSDIDYINIILVSPFITSKSLKEFKDLKLSPIIFSTTTLTSPIILPIKMNLLYDRILPTLEDKFTDKNVLNAIIDLYGIHLPFYFQYIPLSAPENFTSVFKGYFPSHPYIKKEVNEIKTTEKTRRKRIMAQEYNDYKKQIPISIPISEDPYLKCISERNHTLKPIINNTGKFYDINTGHALWSETRLINDIEESGPELVTLPRGTILIHERTTQFPEGKQYPYFVYNWYSNSSFYHKGLPLSGFYTRIFKTPLLGIFESKAPIARYTYQTKYDIPNIIWLENWDELNLLQHYFKSMYNDYPILTGSLADYAVAAFVCQVLNLNGIIIHRVSSLGKVEENKDQKDGHDIIILCNNVLLDEGKGERKSVTTNNYLELKNIELINRPEIHPGYTSTTEPSDGSESGAVKDVPGKVFYTEKEAEKIRTTIPTDYLK